MNAEPNMKDIGMRISLLRKSRNLSQFKLAVLCDSSQSTVQKVESGQLNPRLTTISGIAKALGVSLDYLVWGTTIDVD